MRSLSLRPSGPVPSAFAVPGPGRRLRPGATRAVIRDPAPSRWRYRFQRLMLTPLFRALLKVGLPLVLFLFGGGIWLSSEANRATLAARFAEVRAAIESRPEFQVTSLTIEGAGPAVDAAIRAQLDLTLPVSSLTLDLADMQARIAALSAVREVSLGIRSGGVLAVTVEERQPIAVWRYADGLRLIDAEGAMTGMIGARSDRADLPLIAGDGAKEAIDEALALFAAAEPIAAEMRGLVRMGERRWDMVLDGDRRILLPETGAVEALERVLAWHEAEDLFGRDVIAVDMRDAARPTLRVGPGAVATMRNLTSAAAGE